MSQLIEIKKSMFNKLNIGIDLVEVSRFSNINKNIFTSKEWKQCSKKPNPIQSLAARFAAKEAIRKTIKENIKFNHIEITNTKNGSPKVNFLGKEIKDKYESIVSITHTKKLAQAICLTIKKN